MPFVSLLTPFRSAAGTLGKVGLGNGPPVGKWATGRRVARMMVLAAMKKATDKVQHSIGTRLIIHHVVACTSPNYPKILIPKTGRSRREAAV